jgi:hypothetical protein
MSSFLFRDNLFLQGHSTGQTTGIGGHMAARFIPTVERESIDLVYALPNPCVRTAELTDNPLTLVIAMWQVSIIHLVTL